MRLNGLGLHAGLVVASLFFVFPFIVMILTAMQPPAQGASASGLSLEELTLENFPYVWARTDLGRFLLNSAIVSVTSTVLVVVLGSLAAFGLSQHPFRGSRVLTLVLLSGIVLPAAAIIVPLHRLIRDLGLLNHYVGLIGPYTAFGLPVGILFFMNAFHAIPREITQSARVDGAAPWTIYWRIFMPLAVPAIATVAILQVLVTWNEYLIALVLMTETRMQTAQLSWVVFSGQFVIQFERLFAVLTLLALPVVVVFLFFQRQFVRGLTSGGVNE